MFRGLRKVPGIRIERPQIVMRLDVCRIVFQYSFKFGNRLGSFAAFGQHPSQVVARADEVRIKLDRRIELRKCFFAAARAIQHDPEDIVRNCRVRRSRDGSAGGAFSSGKIV